MIPSVGIAATAFFFTIKPALASIAPFPPGIPSLCQSSCQNLQNSFTNNNKCPSIGVPRCLCTVLIANSLDACLQCFVSIGTITQSNVVNNVNNFITKCAQNGFPIVKAAPSGSSSSLSGNSTSSTTSSLPVTTGLTTSSASADTTDSDSSNTTLPSNTGSESIILTLPIPTSAASKKMSISLSTFGVMIPFSVLLLSY